MIDQADPRRPDSARPGGADAADRQDSSTPPPPAPPPQPHSQPHSQSQSQPHPRPNQPPLPALPWWSWPLAGLVCFALLLWQVASHGPVTGLDMRVRDHILVWAATPSLGWLAALGRGLANLGNQSVALPVLPLVTLFAAWRSRSTLPFVIAAGAAIALAVVIPLKIWVGRPGPGAVVLGDANLGYFPSGHTADAMLCYGTSALILCVAFPAARLMQRVATAVAVALVVGTAFGLLWSDYHWLSDIVGSFCWCGAALLLLHRFAATAGRPRPRPGARSGLTHAQPPVPDRSRRESHHEPEQHHQRGEDERQSAAPATS
jgi:undecaprenyl-diphosphatase